MALLLSAYLFCDWASQVDNANGKQNTQRNKQLQTSAVS